LAVGMEEYSRRGPNQRMRPERARKPTISNRWFSANFRLALTIAGQRNHEDQMSEKPKYQPTERERAVLRKQAQRVVDHPDETVGRELLMEALGTANAHFSGGLLHTLCTAASATKGSRFDQDWFNFMLAVITGIKPNDQLEAMLAAQMAAIHIAMMTFTQRLGTVENIPQQDSAERALNKLARTFTTQMETLKRYRTGGQQNVRCITCP
jgi:hypothetical protein